MLAVEYDDEICHVNKLCGLYTVSMSWLNVYLL